MSTVKTTYPSTSTAAVTISLASLGSGSQYVYTSGRESLAVDNTTNRDLDHLLRGKIRTGTSPTAGRWINVYAVAPRSISSGTPTWPDQCTGADAARSFTSANVMNAIVKLVASITIDSTSARDYDFGPVSVAQLFGSMPSTYSVYVAHDTGVALDSTAGNHIIHYERIQGDVT